MLESSTRQLPQRPSSSSSSRRRVSAGSVGQQQSVPNVGRQHNTVGRQRSSPSSLNRSRPPPGAMSSRSLVSGLSTRSRLRSCPEPDQVCLQLLRSVHTRFRSVHTRFRSVHTRLRSVHIAHCLCKISHSIVYTDYLFAPLVS